MAAKVLLLAGACNALVAPSIQPTKTKLRAATLEEVERIPTPAFGKTFGDDVSKLKAAIFHYGATLDRGQGFNPTQQPSRGMSGPPQTIHEESKAGMLYLVGTLCSMIVLTAITREA